MPSDLNAQDEHGNKNLMLAIWAGRWEAAEELIHQGADVNMENAGITPYLVRSTQDKYRCTKYRRRYGSHARHHNLPVNGFRTSIIIYCNKGKKSLCDLFVRTYTHTASKDL